MAIPSLTFVSGTDQQLSYSVGNPNNAPIQVVAEWNRSADFSSDDTISLRVDVPASTNLAFSGNGFPSGTPWFARVRNINSGEMSNVVLNTTAAVAANTGYAGFSIDKAMLVVPADILLGEITIVDGVQDSGHPASNLLVDSPQATFQTSAAVSYIDFQTSGEPIDTIALLGTLAADSAGLVVQAFSSFPYTGAGLTYNTGELPFRCSPSIGRRAYYHALHTLPAPRSERYWRVAVLNPAPTFIARHLVVGLARKSVNASRGSGVGINDMGSAGRTRLGDPDRVTGWRGKLVDFEMSWLKEAEYHAKWADLPQLVGKTKSVLALPNSKRNVFMNDRIAFGPITEMRAENVASSRHTNSIAIDSLY